MITETNIQREEYRELYKKKIRKNILEDLTLVEFASENILSKRTKLFFLNCD